MNKKISTCVPNQHRHAPRENVQEPNAALLFRGGPMLLSTDVIIQRMATMSW